MKSTFFTMITGLVLSSSAMAESFDVAPHKTLEAGEYIITLSRPDECSAHEINLNKYSNYNGTKGIVYEVVVGDAVYEGPVAAVCRSGMVVGKTYLALSGPSKVRFTTRTQGESELPDARKFKVQVEKIVKTESVKK